MDWREWFKKNPWLSGAGEYAPSVNSEEAYQYFKARLLEETTATEIPEGNRVK